MIHSDTQPPRGEKTLLSDILPSDWQAYAGNLPLSAEMARNLQSFGDGS